MRALLSPLFAWSSWTQPANVKAGTTDEGAAMASVSSVGVGATIHCGGEHDKWGRWSDLFAWSAWAQPATVVAGTSVEGATLACVPSVGVD